MWGNTGRRAMWMVVTHVLPAPALFLYPGSCLNFPSALISYLLIQLLPVPWLAVAPYPMIFLRHKLQSPLAVSPSHLSTSFLSWGRWSANACLRTGSNLFSLSCRHSPWSLCSTFSRLFPLMHFPVPVLSSPSVPFADSHTGCGIITCKDYKLVKLFLANHFQSYCHTCCKQRGGLSATSSKLIFLPLLSFLPVLVVCGHRAIPEQLCYRTQFNQLSRVFCPGLLAQTDGQRNGAVLLPTGRAFKS